ncbi:hypothetical protein ACYAXZ_03795 [Klebsiella pneumoniae]|jgi:hypothetical protein|uniref:hypothetical protein n=1 Tax=Klebsiella TaxID=570 RepID=UPI0007AC9A7F|nr:MULTISPECIES: hypothetical protein [Klebsiella]MBA0068294.1 hypothetical protein [Klebsiella pneumoniae]MDP0790592.1 hypothetical protein [Klebsiella pneumoniae]MDU2307078.1 hypothetical protein [Klebsiella sp.]MDX4463679.1 hypothetical protein [Klebsiella pneumoniae]HBQ5474075.1 hypothetical protein [Klebsiella pneumoniae]
MAKRTLLQKVWDVRRIIDFVKKHGRITTEQVARMTGLPVKHIRLQREPRGAFAMDAWQQSTIVVQLSSLT